MEDPKVLKCPEHREDLGGQERLDDPKGLTGPLEDPEGLKCPEHREDLGGPECLHCPGKLGWSRLYCPLKLKN